MNSLNGLVSVWKALGWSCIVMITTDHQPDLVKHASSRDIQISVLNPDEYKNIISQQSSSSQLLTYFVFAETLLHFEEFRDYLKMFRRPYSSMLVVNGPKQTTYVDSNICQLQLASGFLKVVLKNDTEAALYRIQTLINGGKFVEERWQLNDLGQYKESYDMQGLTVTTVALTWAPWLILDNSCSDGKGCQHTGYLVEVMDALGKICNFTWSITVDPDGIWGDAPLNREDGLQPHDYTGVFGGVVNRKYDIALSIWIYFYERSLFVDYTSAVTSTPRVLLIDDKMLKNFDFSIFIRPFTKESRYVLVLITFSIIALMALFSKTCCSLASQYPSSAKVMALSAWAYFILVQAYYGGALTMFFSSGMSEPFETLREGLEDPDWDFVAQRGSEARMLNGAKDGDKAYVEWVERSESKGLLVSSMKEVFIKLQEGKFFALSEIPRVANFLHNNPMPGFVPRTIGPKMPRDSMLVGGKNSPMTVMLNNGLAKLRQSGLMDSIMAKHTKRLPGVPNQQIQETTTLGGAQVISVFATGGFIMCLVLGLLLVEILVKKLTNVRKLNMDSHFIKQLSIE